MQSEQMKAVAILAYGDKNQLQEINLPMPKAGVHQVVVKMAATSINPIDWKAREGFLQSMYPWTFPIVLGWDAAGEITEVGEGVTEWQVGDQVFARPETTNRGTYAEYTLVDDHLLARKPENISFAEAAAVPLAGLTAWQALFDHGKLQTGETVLIHAGSGGVGTYAIQLAKIFGAKVITTTSQKNFDLVKDLGADEIIDYRTEDFSKMAEKVDLVFDTMGNDVQEKSFSVLKKGGRMVSIVGGTENAEQLAEQYQVTFSAIWLQPDGKELSELAQLLADGKMKSVIGARFPFSKEGIYQAHELSETHHAPGKIVINFQ